MHVPSLIRFGVPYSSEPHELTGGWREQQQQQQHSGWDFHHMPPETRWVTPPLIHSARSRCERVSVHTNTRIIWYLLAVATTTTTTSTVTIRRRLGGAGVSDDDNDDDGGNCATQRAFLTRSATKSRSHGRRTNTQTGITA